MQHRRKADFKFHEYIVLCMGDEFPKTMEVRVSIRVARLRSRSNRTMMTPPGSWLQLTASDWMLATGTVLFRDYFFSIWASCLSLFLSLLVGVKL